MSRFAGWVHETDLTVEDLRRYRRLFGAFGLLMLLNYHWPAAYPDAAFTPPPGPMMLFDGFLPYGVAIAGEIALAVSFACLVFGVRVAWASVAASVLLIGLAGFTYSLGKVNHTILSEVTPALMAAAGWGLTAGPIRAWALRLLAFVLGLSMLSACLFKLLVGWLDTETHAVRAFVIESHFQQGNEAPLSGFVAGLQLGPLWEVLDWVTVLVEGLMIALVFARWRSFRVGLAVLALFHLQVMLVLNIEFSYSIVVYAAFVPWSRVPLPAWLQIPAWSESRRAAAAVGTGIAAWALTYQFGNPLWILSPALLWAAAVVAVWYLVSLVVGARSSAEDGNRELEVAGPPARG